MVKPDEFRDQNTVQEHPMVEELLVELQEIDDRRQWEGRLYRLMNQHSHIGIPVQYERLFLRSHAGKEEKQHDYQRGRGQSNRRRVSH
jgi:hypothetical protein